MIQCAGCDSKDEDLYYQLDWPGLCQTCLDVAKCIHESMPRMVRTAAQLIALVRVKREQA